MVQVDLVVERQEEIQVLLDLQLLGHHSQEQ